jgi:import inner membrane translocase subunit TIM22
MSYDSALTPASEAIRNLSTKEQIRRGLKDMGTRSYSSAKNFGLIGAIFSGTECAIESVSGALSYRLAAICNFDDSC